MVEMMSRQSLLPGNSWLTSQTRRRAAIISIAVTILGIYLNVSINYANFISNRARASADLLQSLNAGYGATVAANGNRCLLFANMEFEKLASADPQKPASADAQKAKAEQVRAIVNGMWKNKTDERSFEGLSKDERHVLVQCLASADVSEPKEVLPGVSQDLEKLSALTMARHHIRKQIFGYLNLHETIFDLVRTEKIDSRMICKQIRNDLNADHPAIKFVTNILRQHLGENEVRESYPGLSWYSRNLSYCHGDWGLWFENVVKPVLPSISERT
jgi:hypothetical protein